MKTTLLINIKKLLKPKNIIFLIFALAIILLIGSVFRYIYIQNNRYQQLSEESVIEQREERTAGEEKLLEKESPEPIEQKTGTVETEFRDNMIMIF